MSKFESYDKTRLSVLMTFSPNSKTQHLMRKIRNDILKIKHKRRLLYEIKFNGI